MGKRAIKANVLISTNLLLNILFLLENKSTNPVRTTVTPKSRVRKAREAKIADIKRGRYWSLFKYRSIWNMDKSVNNIKSGSVHAYIDTRISAIDNRIEAEPKNTSQRDLIFFKSQELEINIINPKIIACRYRMTLKALKPKNSINANKDGNKGI